MTVEACESTMLSVDALVVEFTNNEFGIKIEPCELELSVMISFRHFVTDI